MSTPEIKGWCPSAHKPMASGDGLVVRIRPRLGEMSADQARHIAGLAERFGNGLIDLTSRANLQLRGVRETGHSNLIEELISLDLVDPDPQLDARLNIVLDPLHRQHGTEIAKALAEGLKDPVFAALPSKFGFVVDTSDSGQLIETPGDIRVETVGHTLMIRADGSATAHAVTTPAEAASAALDMARWFLNEGGVGPDGRGRMRGLLARGATLPDHLGAPLPQNATRHPPEATETRRGSATSVGPKAHGHRPPAPGLLPEGLMIAAAFGQLTPNDLRQLAELAPSALRITPWRMVFLPGATTTPDLSNTTLSLDPTDPLRRIDACTGAPACPQAHADSRTLARALARTLPQDQSLHVSGCAKGCARQTPADVVLVAQSGGFDLVRQGRPCDAPHLTGLTRPQAETIFET